MPIAFQCIECFKACRHGVNKNRFRLLGCTQTLDGRHNLVRVDSTSPFQSLGTSPILHVPVYDPWAFLGCSYHTPWETVRAKLTGLLHSFQDLQIQMPNCPDLAAAVSVVHICLLRVSSFTHYFLLLQELLSIYDAIHLSYQNAGGAAGGGASGLLELELIHSAIIAIQSPHIPNEVEMD